MRFKLWIVCALGITLLCVELLSIRVFAVTKDKTDVISSNLNELQALPSVINSVKPPELKNPDWLQAQLDAEAKQRAAEQAQTSQSYNARAFTGGVVTFSVATRGAITANIGEFESLASQTLNDARGWSRLGVSFQEVASGGNFTLWLSEAGQVPSFYPSVCSVYWSCSVGRNVIINQDRWLYASDSWNQSGGSLRDYRNMVINHETGHWLGHGHLYACGTGQFAPAMMQQSINLNGCRFNPWPLNSELWSSTLGI